MRAGPGRTVALPSAGFFERTRSGWLQAGFSLAYRLAHLSAPRLVVTATLAAAFYIL